MGEWLDKLRKMAGNWPDLAAPYFIQEWGLDSIFAVRVGLLYLALHFAGLRPRITSGFRDPRKQAAMRAAWDRGERAGLVVRPADPKNSLHCLEAGGRPASRAIDMPCDNNVLAAEIARGLGLRAGQYFSTPDPGHYDMGGV